MIYSGPGIILVCAFSCPSDNTIFLFFPSGVIWGNGTGVSAFIFPIIFFGDFSLLPVKYWLLIGWKYYQIFIGSLVGVHTGMLLQYTPLQVLHWWLDLITMSFSFWFLPGSLLRVFFGLPTCLAPLEVLLGFLLFWVYWIGYSMLPCVHTLISQKVLQVLDSVLYWGCMICDTCSVSFMVLCTSHLIHVVPTMHGHLVCYA